MIALMGVGTLFHVLALAAAALGMPTTVFLVLLLWNAIAFAQYPATCTGNSTYVWIRADGILYFCHRSRDGGHHSG